MAKRDRQFYINAARQYALQAGLSDPRVFLAMLRQESGFNPGAVSYAGARGIAQIMPFHDVDPNKPGKQLSGQDPLMDLRWAANHLAQNVRKYGGSYEKALSVYNSGQPDKYLDPNFAKGQTYNYVKRIMGSLGQFAPGKGPGGGGVSAAPTRTQIPSAAPPPTFDRSALQRQALLGSLVDRQKAYLEGSDYAGPSASQRLSELMSLLPQSAPASPAPSQPRASTATPGGVPVGRDGKPLKGAALMASLISEAQRRGLRVSENAAVDHVDPVHTKGSDHYKTIPGSKYSAALDVGGNTNQLRDYFLWAQRFAGRGLKDMFFDPMKFSYDEGKRWNKTIGGHGTHVHASVFI